MAARHSQRAQEWFGKVWERFGKVWERFLKDFLFFQHFSKSHSGIRIRAELVEILKIIEKTENI